MSVRQQKVIAKWQPQGQTKTTFNLKDTGNLQKSWKPHHGATLGPGPEEKDAKGEPGEAEPHLKKGSPYSVTIHMCCRAVWCPTSNVQYVMVEASLLPSKLM